MALVFTKHCRFSALLLHIYLDNQQDYIVKKTNTGMANLGTYIFIWQIKALILAIYGHEMYTTKMKVRHGNQVASKSLPTCNHPPSIDSWASVQKNHITVNPHKLKELYTFTFLLFPGKRKKKLIYKHVDPVSCENFFYNDKKKTLNKFTFHLFRWAMNASLTVFSWCQSIEILKPNLQELKQLDIKSAQPNKKLNKKG
jgi:hypothetical protein